MTNPTYSTGTVSVSAAGTIVTGIGTIWSGVNAKAGDMIAIDGLEPVEIKDITDTTHLTLWAPWAGGAKTSVTYILIQNYPARVTGVAAAEDVGTMIAKLKTGGLPFLVEAPETVPDPSLGADGQYAIEPISGEQWLKTGGVWVSQGIFRAFGVAAPWSSVTAYQVNNVATLAGTSYICILAHTNHTPPNATYWTVLASKGDTGATGPAAWTAPAAWLTATAYVSGPPASEVVQGGETYVCLVSHTSGTFATDLAAAKWIKVAQKGTDGTNGTNGTNGVGYGGTSTTSLAIATGSKAFATQAGLAYQVGGYVRASSAANGANYMEGFVTAYSGTSLTINVTVVGGSGTKTDWNFAVAGAPGVGDMLKSDNLSGMSSARASIDNISAHGADIASSSTVNLETATGDLVDVTGATTITAITLSEGHERTVRFTGALTLTNGASLVLPGGANITTAAGDFAVFRGYASSVVRCVEYAPVSGKAVVRTDSIGQIPGETSTGSASAGNVGEYVSSVVASGSAVSLTGGTAANLTFVDLTAGDWDVTASFHFTGAGSTTVSYAEGSISTTSITADFNSLNTTYMANVAYFGAVNGNGFGVVSGTRRISVSTTTRVYAVAQANFGTSTMSVYGTQRARRVR